MPIAGDETMLLPEGDEVGVAEDGAEEVTITRLDSVVAEEQASVGAHPHLEAGGAAPHRRLPDQEGEGAALIAPKKVAISLRFWRTDQTKSDAQGKRQRLSR
ncbi:hypothetical protein EYF80_035510 [Liparis tanakae]|uniref:Uncharacterized protein n=1 Tax=Liparis tanakae TaxID=230148 RepID=A0A4Z2GNP7_9TELE|nr:hypothetical protein EYF80_035510 [Liparis tanakae]